MEIIFGEEYIYDGGFFIEEDDEVGIIYDGGLFIDEDDEFDYINGGVFDENSN